MVGSHPGGVPAIDSQRAQALGRRHQVGRHHAAVTHARRTALSHPVVPALSAAVLFQAGTVCAQEYPSKPVRIIVPFTAAGGTDILARSLAQRLSETMGQQVLVDNRPGGNGLIGAEAVARAAPDGYVLLHVDQRPHDQSVAASAHSYSIERDLDADHAGGLRAEPAGGASFGAREERERARSRSPGRNPVSSRCPTPASARRRILQASCSSRPRASTS